MCSGEVDPMTDRLSPDQIASMSRRELIAAISAVGAAAAFGIPERAAAVTPPPDVEASVRRAAEVAEIGRASCRERV